ncbi:MAG: 1-acyl-sn-glycerol-3-phosphate acyltransferase, partial [Pseudomonadota bacterium]
MSNRSRFRSARFFYALFGRVVKLLVRAQMLPPEPEFDRDAPVCYMLDSDAVSNVMILQQLCEARGLPMPLDELPLEGGPEMRSTIQLQRIRGVFVRRTDLREHLGQLSALIEAVESGSCSDVQLVPVSVFLGRTPDKETGLWRILFSENWPVAGRFRRFLSMVIHGRETIVQFSRPISLQEQIDEGIGRPRTVRKISRVLRVHFRRVRASVIGPDLSHRRTLVDDILRAPQVREAIKTAAKRDGVSVAKARRRARGYAMEIAADYSYPVVRVFARVLSWFWNRIYDGVRVHHLKHLTDVSAGAEIIYVPCHRSHIDYLLLSYIVHDVGIVIPHIAAGVNLNLPVVGPILRRGGAFFLRRSFRAKPLYSAVFHEYVETIFRKGVPMEFFIEGTRSRTGRALEPRTGMLAMTVRNYLRHPHRPTVFVPVYFGYERLVEGGAYLGELSGGQKKRETLSGLFSSYQVLREQYGEVNLS